MPVSVVDLAKYYADNPPPKYDTLADLEARLEELRPPGYRSPFKFDTSLGVGPLGTTGYGTIGTYGSVSELLKAPVPHVASLYPLHRAARLTKSDATYVSDLFAQRLGTSSSPLWTQLAERHFFSSGLIGFGNFPYETDDFFKKALKKWGIRSLEETVQRWIDALGSAQPAELHPLELAAYEARGHLMAGRIEKVNRFLRQWLRISEFDAELYEAMMRVLDRKFERRLSALENPAAWLRQAVLRERAGILAERDQVDAYIQKLAEERDAETDAYHEPGKTFYLPPRTTYVANPLDKPHPFARPKNTGMRPPSAEDPYLLVPNKHGSWRQALEELADSGRHPTRERAQLTLEYRQELEDQEVAFSRKEWLQRVGGADAERALKEAARTRHKRILEESA